MPPRLLFCSYEPRLFLPWCIFIYHHFHFQQTTQLTVVHLMIRYYESYFFASYQIGSQSCNAAARWGPVSAALCKFFWIILYCNMYTPAEINLTQPFLSPIQHRGSLRSQAIIRINIIQRLIDFVHFFTQYEPNSNTDSGVYVGWPKKALTELSSHT